MPRPRFKTLCRRCRGKYIVASHKDRYPACYDCQKKEMEGEISDSEMKEMFDIPEDFYRESIFLRSIKIKYLNYGDLSDNQIESFKKVVEEMREN